MKFGSVCSGIEAASVAWHPLGWQAAWLSEIEPFPSAVLAHHYPTVPNLGDMTLLPERIASGEVEAPDLFCGGTPCQAFSVAGLRQSLDDDRGNLSLTFVEIANAIDNRRLDAGHVPTIIFWENVPGVLNTKDNAFGCFLGALAGEDAPLEPAGKRWTNAGCVYGPQRTVAWRVLDAQYFGVAQRRRRVFVVASARDDFDPAAVLFESEGVRRDTAPRREAGERIAPCVTNGPPFSRTKNERVEAEAMVVVARMVAFGEYSVDGTASAMKARDYKDATDLVAQVVGALACNTGPNGHDAGNFACNQAVDAGHVLPVVRDVGEVCTTVSATYGSGGGNVPITLAQSIPFDTTQITSPYNYSNPQAGDPCHPLAAGAHPPAVAQPIAWDEELNPSVDIAGTLLRGGAGGRHDGVAQPIVYELHDQDARLKEVSVAPTLHAKSDNTCDLPVVLRPNMAVRRLMLVECERLQGFPDGYTNIPWRKKPESPDGPRYKALGNSWAVPVVAWIGRRIEGHLS